MFFVKSLFLLSLLPSKYINTLSNLTYNILDTLFLFFYYFSTIFFFFE